MAEPFLAELRLMSFNFPPKGWAMCNGQLMPINQNQALFSLLGTTYGGNGQTNFALPDLRSRAPMHMGNGFTLGQRFGEESHTVTLQEMATHNHFVNASSSNGDRADIGIMGGLSEAYGDYANVTTLHPATVTNTGGSQPHNNLQPYIVLNWCVALQGIFPSQN
jgi:microcystin-dependent protein